MNTQIHRIPTIDQMRKIVVNSLESSDEASWIVKRAERLYDIVDEYRYEQRWQDKITKEIYCVVCEDVRLRPLIIKIDPLDCHM